VDRHEGLLDRFARAQRPEDAVLEQQLGGALRGRFRALVAGRDRVLV